MSGRNRTVVITGASAGVGRATARAFAREGARIALIARGGERLVATKREVEALGGRSLVLPLDVADAAAVEAAAAHTEKELGPIDAWVNNAMTSVFSPVREMDAEDYKRVTEVTYLGYVYGTLAALKRMLPRNRGVIIQVGSSLAYRGIPLQSSYCAAKHAIQGFVDSLRCELLHDRSKVRVTMVQLPALNTPQFSWVKNRLPRKLQPMGPIFQPEVAADAIVWASHHNRREIFVSGSTVKAILANRLAPGLLDHYLARKGVEGQQRDGPADANAPNNLYQPVPGEYGAHGAFDEQSRGRSVQLWGTKHRGWVILGAIAMGIAVSGLLQNGDD